MWHPVSLLHNVCLLLTFVCPWLNFGWKPNDPKFASILDLAPVELTRKLRVGFQPLPLKGGARLENSFSFLSPRRLELLTEDRWTVLKN